MKQEGLLYFSDTYLTVLGLMIFLGYFVFMLIRVLKMKNTNIDYLQNIPFEDGEQK